MIAACIALSGALWGARPVVVAIVDDAFELSSEPARGFWYDSIQARKLANPALAPWDLADNDPDVAPPKARAADFWHGTAEANLLAERLGRFLGKDASSLVRFVPIKVLSDGAPRPDMSLGYLGIQRAARAQADVILCAWSGGTPGDGQVEMVREAQRSGALVLAAAGNEATRRPQFPASLPGVVAVGALDSMGRRKFLSCRGDWVTLSAPGDTERVSVRPLLPDSVGFSQTSRAATEVAALAIALKVDHPAWNANKIRQVLMESSMLLEPRYPGVSGTLGAGALDPVHALVGTWDARLPSGMERHPAGMLPLSERAWTVDLDGPGSFRGIRMGLAGEVDSTVRVRATAPDGQSYDWTARELTQGVEIPYPRLALNWKGTSKPGGYLEFRKLELDSSTLFCHGTRELSGDSGHASDGSGSAPYAHECDCKWQIHVPPGHRIRLDFDSFQTAAGLDQLHVFQGTATLPQNLMALFSGPHLPPPLVSLGNDLLLWFPSSTTGVGQGFSFHWKSVPDTTRPGLAQPWVMDTAR
ncbi:MAG TPA: S8 family serine peptidase [Fibrobacteria bacterium]|nr:S8 family serine peptidase [Fibrobacteria bacterium]